MGNDSLPKGVIVDVPTPLSEEGMVEWDTYSSLIKDLCSVFSMLLIGSPRMGLGNSLDKTERLRLLRIAVESASRDVLLFFYVSTRKREEVIDLISHLNTEYDTSNALNNIVIVDSPLIYHSNRGLVELYKVLCGLTKLPFVLYNDPELIKSLGIPLKRTNIRTSILKELLTLPSIKGIISYGPFSRIKNYEKAARIRPGFKVYDGDEMRFLDYPNKDGVVSIMANLKQLQWKELVDYSLGLKRFGSESRMGSDYFISLVQEIRDFKNTTPFLKETIQEYIRERYKK